LLWEGGREFDEKHGPWKFNGPRLSIEFSRISERRRGALTLVVDDHGTPTTVAWCLSNRNEVDDAAHDLRVREDTTIANIGRVELNRAADNSTGVAATVAAWAKRSKLDAAVWTALPSNFSSRVGKPFSVEAAVAYVKGLSPEGKAKAAEYVWRAPDFVQTPVRAVLQREPWFRRPTANV